MKKNNTNYKVSLIMNLVIVIFTLFATIAMFTGFKFMTENDLPLQLKRIEMFKFFTVDSNLFMGIVSFIFVIEDIQMLKGVKKEISSKLYVLKLASTTSVGLTFFVVFTYLGPFSEYGIIKMVLNSNLFFHLLTPLLSIFTFIFFEKTNKIKFKYLPSSLIPMVIYAVFYSINSFTHIVDGSVSMEYDFYGFIQNGIWTIIIVVPVMLIITLLIGYTLWKLNKNIK